MLKPNQLEELARLHETEDFEEPRDNRGTFDDNADSAAAWRRGMIENALSNVKKAIERTAKVGGIYEANTLVFDTSAKKFARVVQAAADGLELKYISGGTQAYGAPIELEAESAETTEDDDEAPETSKNKPTLKTVTKTKSNSRKPAAKKAPTAKKNPAKKLTTSKSTKAPVRASAPATKPSAKRTAHNYTEHIPEGFTTDPVADPNGYIQQNFTLMNNKELASVTGLSEHTIRRKLGEWGLKRKRA